VNDDNGQKMSKRLGNVIEPEKACDTYGADVVRYWVASVDFVNDPPASENILKAFGESYRNVRNALRFLLGNLYDYDPAATPELVAEDQWVMEQVDLLADECVKAFAVYDFGAVITGVHNFCRNELSSFYLDVIKDRMYCDGAAWDSRRSGQIACRYVLDRLVRLIAPILPFTAEETWQRMQGRLAEGGLTDEEVKRSVHCQIFDMPDWTRLAKIEASTSEQRFASLLEARSDVSLYFEQWRERHGIKDSQDAVVTYTVTAKTELIRSFSADQLAIFFKVSEVVLNEAAPGASLEPESLIQFSASPYEKCERSRLRRPDVKNVSGVMLTDRDAKVLRERGELEA
jgi:isoleucyl-tRNA synthetase